MSEKNPKLRQANEKDTDLVADNLEMELKAVVNGEIINIEELADPVFSSKMIGDGYGIRPTGKKIYSPVSGKIEEVAMTKHAVYLSTANNIKLLIHIGIDTIKLKGEGFITSLENGMKIDQGDLLIEFNPKFIEDEGLDPVVSVIILDRKDKIIDVIVFPTKNAKANETVALKAIIH